MVEVLRGRELYLCNLMFTVGILSYTTDISFRPPNAGYPPGKRGASAAFGS
jgi:hypothetical protein